MRFEAYKTSSGTWQWRFVDPEGQPQIPLKSTGWTSAGWQGAGRRDKQTLNPAAAFEPSAVIPEPEPPASLVRVIGTDFGSKPVPALSWFQAARAAGFEGAWVPSGSWNPERGSFWWRTLEVLSLYEQAGFKYLLTYHRPNVKVLEAWQALGEWKRKISAFTFDVEDPGEPLRPADVDAVIAAMAADGVDPNKRLWLYSAKYVWQDVQGLDDQRFAGRFSHIAPYSGRIEGWPTSIPAIELWGGFTQAQVDGLQLRGAEAADIVTFEGINVHESIFDRASLAVG